MVCVVILNERQTRFLINLLLFLTFDLMLLGAGVRTMDAGLTCPDWPMCFGKAIPDYHFGVYLEFIHRAIAGILSLIFLVFFIVVWKNQAFKKLRVFSLISLFLLVAQVIMGGLTVLKLLEAYIVTMHLTLATCFLVSLYVMKLKLKDHSQLKPVKKSIWPKIFKVNVLAGVFFVIVQIVLGGLVASTYSGLICVDFPTCNGQMFPAFTGAVGIQVIHRLGAYWLGFLTASLFMLALFAAPKIGLKQSHRIQAVKIFLLVCTQMAIGILNLKFLIPPWLSVVHLGMALTILLMTLKLSFQLKTQKA